MRWLESAASESNAPPRIRTHLAVARRSLRLWLPGPRDRATLRIAEGSCVVPWRCGRGRRGTRHARADRARADVAGSRSSGRCQSARSALACARRRPLRPRARPAGGGSWSSPSLASGRAQTSLRVSAAPRRGNHAGTRALRSPTIRSTCTRRAAYPSHSPST